MKKSTIPVLSAIAILSLQVNASPYVMCHFNSFTAPHSSTIQYNVESTHQVVITNETDKSQKYTITYQTLIDKRIVHYITKDIELRPYGTFNDDDLSSKKQIFKSKGKYDASCATFVGKMGENKMTYIFGGGYINIT